MTPKLPPNIDPTHRLIRQEWQHFLTQAAETLSTRWPEELSTLQTTQLICSERLTRTAGRAGTTWTSRAHRAAPSCQVKISAPIFRRHFEKVHELRMTIIHEAAHILQYADGKAHNPHDCDWYFWDKLLGGNGSIYHYLDTSPEDSGIEI